MQKSPSKTKNILTNKSSNLNLNNNISEKLNNISPMKLKTKDSKEQLKDNKQNPSLQLKGSSNKVISNMIKKSFVSRKEEKSLISSPDKKGCISDFSNPISDSKSQIKSDNHSHNISQINSNINSQNNNNKNQKSIDNSPINKLDNSQSKLIGDEQLVFELSKSPNDKNQYNSQLINENMDNHIDKEINYFIKANQNELDSPLKISDFPFKTSQNNTQINLLTKENTRLKNNYEKDISGLNKQIKELEEFVTKANDKIKKIDRDKEKQKEQSKVLQEQMDIIEQQSLDKISDFKSQQSLKDKNKIKSKQEIKEDLTEVKTENNAKPTNDLQKQINAQKSTIQSMDDLIKEMEENDSNLQLELNILKQDNFKLKAENTNLINIIKNKEIKSEKGDINFDEIKNRQASLGQAQYTSGRKIKKNLLYNLLYKNFNDETMSNMSHSVLEF